jgi:hypothetical protein
MEAHGDVGTAHMAGRDQITLLHSLGNVGNFALEGDEFLLQQLVEARQPGCGFQPDTRGLVIESLAERA